MKPPAVGSTWTARNHPALNTARVLPVRVAATTAGHVVTEDYDGHRATHTVEAFRFWYEPDPDPAVWFDGGSSLGETVPWPMGANE